MFPGNIFKEINDLGDLDHEYFVLYFTSTGKSSRQLSLKENVAKVFGASSCGGFFCSFRWTNTLPLSSLSTYSM